MKVEAEVKKPIGEQDTDSDSKIERGGSEKPT